MTQMATALRAAGYGSTAERLFDIAVEVLGVHPEPRSTAAQEALYARVLSHADLLCELFATFREAALRRYLLLTVDAIKEEARLREPKARSGGREKHGNPSGGAPAARPGGSGGQSMTSDSQILRAAAPPTMASALLAKAEAQAASRRRGMEIVGKSLLLSWVEDFKIDGVSLFKTNFGHVRKWARDRGREAQWLLMLAANRPAQQIVGEHITPADAEEYWRRMVRLATGDEAAA